MRQLFMKQQVSKGKDNYVIKDRRGTELYSVSLTDGELEEFLFVSNKRKEQIVLVKHNKEQDVKKFVIYSDNQETLSIEFNEATKECKMISNELVIAGDILDMTFDVMYGYRKVGKVRKRWVFSEDAYEITIFESDREKEIIGLIATLRFAQLLEDVA